MFAAAIALALLGVVIGLELLTRVGITPNTSIVGAILAMGLARLPLVVLAPLRSVARQNLLQTVISAATFGGANAIFLPLGIVWLIGHRELLLPMFIGVTLGMLIDACVLYWLFDSPVYPASGAWPAGVATAECLLAGDRGGRRARLLAVGAAIGGVGQTFGIPMDVVGVCWIGNAWALTMFGVGLLVRAYAQPVAGVEIEPLYIPHGVMIGAGLIAMIQIAVALGRPSAPGVRTAGGEANVAASGGHDVSASHGVRPRVAISGGFALYLAAACVMATLGGLYASMSAAELVAFVIFAAFAALVHDLIVGISAMHAGWFPAFATALIFLIVGTLFGFAAAPLALLVGFTAATGPAFADLGYDLKTGWIVRGFGGNAIAERDGRWQQFVAAMVGFVVAAVFVWVVHERYFDLDRFPPADRVYAATITAGADPALVGSLAMWALPGAIVQAIGGASRQIGVLFATGLLINNGAAGFAALAALAVRFGIERRAGDRAAGPMYVLAGGFLAGSALVSFALAMLKSS